jgi:murein L,D-transpeptidase YafK
MIRILLFLLFLSKNLSALESIDFIIVNKEKRDIIMYKEGKVLNKFKVSLGFEPIGAKVKRGDGKTPEGLYYIEDKIKESSFYLALKVSYPNPWDIRRALDLNYHPGGQIMIHGVPNSGYDRKYHNSNNDWTEGCVAISNLQMLKIWKKISIGTPILIKK